jgi:hypothetical protein
MTLYTVQSRGKKWRGRQIGEQQVMRRVSKKWRMGGDHEECSCSSIAFAAQAAVTTQKTFPTTSISE